MAGTKLKRVIRGPYTPRDRVITLNPGDSMTEQSFRDECDVNKILKSFGAVKASPAYQEKMASAEFGYAPSESYHEALEIGRQSAEIFSELPSALRKRFNNNPGELLAFVENDENYDEAVELQLVPAPVIPDEPGLVPKAPINAVKPSSGSPEETAPDSPPT